MAVRVYINDITGNTPYQVFICQSGNIGCFFITEITNGDLPYEFDIPAPYNNSDSYLLKIIDSSGCIISGDTLTLTPTPSVSFGFTPTQTPTNTITPTQTPTNTITPTQTPTNTITPTGTPTPSVTFGLTPTATETPSQTPTSTSSVTVTPTATPTRTPNVTPTRTPNPYSPPYGY